jgi:hypothetical protein
MSTTVVFSVPERLRKPENVKFLHAYLFAIENLLDIFENGELHKEEDVRRGIMASSI